MLSYHITIDYANQPEILEQSDNSPECSLATTRIRGNRGFFRIDVAVIGPKPEESESYLYLGRREVHDLNEAILDFIIPLEQKLR